jgi:hypothetical protein
VDTSQTATMTQAANVQADRFPSQVQIPLT